MKKKKPKIILTKKKPERVLKNPKREQYLLQLYITGSSQQSLNSIINIKKICEMYLRGSYKMDVINLYHKSNQVKGDQLLVAHTMIKTLPQPLQKIMGNLSNTEKMLVGLDLEAWNNKQEL